MGQSLTISCLIGYVIWLGAGIGLWLYLSNRIIFHWASVASKIAAMALLALGLLALALVAHAHEKRLIWQGAATLVCCAFGAGELHRAWLRYQCRGHAERFTAVARTDWSRPFTTTNLRVHHYVMKVPQEIGRLRIAHLTDLHITPEVPWAYYASIVERTNQEAPDVVLLTGDFLSKAEHLPLLQRWLALPLRARLGVYAVLGNHDYWAGIDNEVRQALELANVAVLSGACIRLSGDGFDHVVFCGTEWPWGSDFVAPNPSAGDFVVALSHTPDNIYLLRGRAHVVFAGHNHGGQWRVPGIGALIVPSLFGRRFDLGNFSVDGTELFVSAGLGVVNLPLRVYCPPELLLVDFVGSNIAIAQGAEGSRASGRPN